MQMYEAVWESDGERMVGLCVHAMNEADALAQAEVFFAEHPEHDIPGRREGMTVRVGAVVRVDGGSFKTIFKETPDA
jgi:hypothetical protein